MKIDPYDTLGVDRKADEPAVRRAYRKRAKTVHPDKGGTAEAFDDLSRSLALLTDPKRREHYDRTGEWGFDTPNNPLSGPISVILKFFNDTVSQFVEGKGGDPMAHDLAQVGQRVIGLQLETLRKTQAMGEKHIATTERIIERLAKKDGAPHVQNALKWQVQQIRNQLRPVEEDIASHVAAIEMLKDYTFKFDAPPPPVQAFTYGQPAQTDWTRAFGGFG